MKTRFKALQAATRLCLVVLMALGFHLTGHAQRTMRDQNLLTMSVATPCTSIKDFGGNVSYGRYLLDSYWKVSVSAVPQGVKLSTGDRMQLLTIRAAGDYMYRIASVRSRAFSLYGGGGAFIGYELNDPFSRLPSNIHTGLPNGAFIYGVNVNIEAEVFITRRVALTVGCTTPLTFGSVTKWFRINAIAGVRINI